MKTFIKVLLISVPVLLFGCDKDEDPLDAGEIYGYDINKCACCGGYMIKIKNQEYKFFDEDVQGDNPLHLVDIRYPAFVRLKWSVKPGDCADRIVVHELQLSTAG